MIDRLHIYGHKYRRGGCQTCGYHCIDCPVGIPACKCTPVIKKPEHKITDKCYNTYCRLHFFSRWPHTTGKYPATFTIKTSEMGWVSVKVFHGPAAFYPKKPKIQGY